MNPQRPTISKTPVPAATGQNVARKSVSFQPMPPPPNPPARGPSTIKTIAAKSGSPLGRETGGPRYIVPSKSVPRAGPSTSKVGAKSAMSTPRKSMPGTKSWSGNYGSGPQSRVYTKQVGWIPSRGGPRPQQGPARKSYAYASSNDQNAIRSKTHTSQPRPSLPGKQPTKAARKSLHPHPPHPHPPFTYIASPARSTHSTPPSKSSLPLPDWLIKNLRREDGGAHIPLGIDALSWSAAPRMRMVARSMGGRERTEVAKRSPAIKLLPDGRSVRSVDVDVDSDVDEESSADDEVSSDHSSADLNPSHHHTNRKGVKAARKLFPPVVPARRTQLATKAAKKTHAVSATAESDISMNSDLDEPEDTGYPLESNPSSDRPQPDSPSDSEPEVEWELRSPELILDWYSSAVGLLGSIHRLPFLRRNLRRGFFNHCLALGVPVGPGEEKEVLDVLYRYHNPDLDEDDEEEEGEGEICEWMVGGIREWVCPLCGPVLFGPFANRRMLMSHMEWDHESVGVVWEAEKDGDEVSRWKIVVNLPKREDSISGPPSSSSSSSSSEEELETELVRTPLITPSAEPEVVIHPRTPSPLRSLEHEVIPVPQHTSPIHLKFKFQPAPPSSHATSPFPSTSSSSTYTRAESTTSSIPTTLNGVPLGPAANPPYLPYGPSLHFSCRPGGPRLYDLLGACDEPLEAKFGVLKWFVIDKEEKIFELDDVRDEDKVIMALWGRWILLNRNAFVANYVMGTMTFVDEYWEMIHLAAGWLALRQWLLMLVVNRFLTGAQVAKVLMHYEGLVLGRREMSVAV